MAERVATETGLRLQKFFSIIIFVRYLNAH